MWTIISRDYSRRTDGQKCVRNVVPYLESGAIIAFHDSIKCAGNLFEALDGINVAIDMNNVVSKFPVLLQRKGTLLLPSHG